MDKAQWPGRARLLLIALVLGQVLAGCSLADDGDSPPTGPGNREAFVMAYQPKFERVIVYGGRAQYSSDPESDSWSWDGTQWQQLSSGTLSSRRDPAATYDSSRDLILLFGGAKVRGAIASGTDEMYELSESGWGRRLHRGDIGGYSGHALAFDSKREVALLFGGITDFEMNDSIWELSGGETWIEKTNEIAPAPRLGHAMVYDQERGVTVLFGGANGTYGSDYVKFDDTWLWDGTEWQEAHPANSPNGRDGHAMAYDSSRGVVVLYGGSDEEDVWEWDGSEWHDVTPSGPSPGPRYSFGMAYDSKRGVTLLYGGQPQDPDDPDEIWEWDGTAWAVH